MPSTIQKRLIKTLLIGGTILSILAGLAVALLQLEEIDQKVVSLAIAESTSYNDLYHRYFHSKDSGTYAQLKAKIRQSLESDVFILIEIYREDKTKLIAENLPGSEAISRELERKRDGFLMNNRTDYQKIYLHHNLYVKILAPLYAPDNGAIIGYFEGVYHVSAKDMTTIEHRFLFSVLQSVVLVLLTTLLLLPIILHLAKGLLNRTRQLLEANIDTLKSLGGAVAKRDSDTSAHNYRVTILAVAIAEAMQVKKEEIRSLIKGAFLHDVGKIAISDAILRKRGPLSEDERDIMQTHVSHGMEIIQRNAWLADARDVVANHHEKVDGSGYPLGLQGESIPLIARIFIVADVFDALTSKRPYKEAYSFEKSMRIIEGGKGGHFDEEVVRAFTTIAAAMYGELQACQNEQTLSDRLDSSIHRYFSL